MLELTDIHNNLIRVHCSVCNDDITKKYYCFTFIRAEYGGYLEAVICSHCSNAIVKNSDILPIVKKAKICYRRPQQENAQSTAMLLF